jgi:hypothetical protein
MFIWQTNPQMPTNLEKQKSTGVANKIKIAFDSTMYEQATVVDSQQWNKSSI